MENILKQLNEKYHLDIEHSSGDNASVNFMEGKVQFGNDQNENIEVLQTHIFNQYSDLGSMLRQHQRDFTLLQQMVLGDLTAQVQDLKPIVIPYSGETRVFVGKDLDNSLDNYEAMLAFVHQKSFDSNDAVVLVNKDVPLAKQYLQAAKSFNHLDQNAETYKLGLKIWMGRKLYDMAGTSEEFDKLVKSVANQDAKAFSFYSEIEALEKKAGPLSALLISGVGPKFTPAYLKSVTLENIESPEIMLTESDMSRRNKFILSLYQEDQADTVNLGKIRISTGSLGDFEKRLFYGDISLNDLVLDGVDLQESKKFDEFIGKFREYNFSDEQVKGIKGRAMEILGMAQKRQQALAQLESKPSKDPRWMRKRESMAQQTAGLCQNSLKHLAFALRYENDSSNRFTTQDIVTSPTSDIEKYMASSLNLSSRVSSQGFFKMIYLVNEAILNGSVPSAKVKEVQKEVKSKEDGKLGLAGFLAGKK